MIMCISYSVDKLSIDKTNGDKYIACKIIINISDLRLMHF